MKSILIISIFLFSFSAFSQAEFVNENLETDENETVLEKSFFETLSLEEPVFSSPSTERDVASIAPAKKSTEVESIGQLEVVKEIPYTYRWVSHRTIQLRVLNEIEQSDLKAKETATN